MFFQYSIQLSRAEKSCPILFLGDGLSRKREGNNNIFFYIFIFSSKLLDNLE